MDKDKQKPRKEYNIYNKDIIRMLRKKYGTTPHFIYLQKCKAVFCRFAKNKKMNIVVEFSIYPRFLEDIEEPVRAVFENLPYVPEATDGLWVKWEDFYDQETADKIYSSLRNNLLVARKLMERFEKDRIFVQFEYLPYFPDMDDEDFDEDYDDEEPFDDRLN